MESQSTTVSSPLSRWYEDACGTALALEFVGERWALLVIRELMFGPRRFGELKADLPGISANVLTQRLTGLEQAGVVRRRRLPSPANVQVYELTPWGLEAEPILQVMGQWATRSRHHDPTLFLSPAAAMMSLRTMIDRDGACGLNGTLAFRFPRDNFVARLGAKGPTVVRGEGPADVMLTTDPPTLAAVVYGKQPFEAAEEAGTLAIEGDRSLAHAFVDLFSLPAKIA